MKKKILKIIFISLFLLLFPIIIGEIAAERIIFNDTGIHLPSYEQQDFITYKNYPKYEFVFKEYPQPNSKKNIILFGDSVAYGMYLQKEESFGYQLAKRTGFTVYNRAFPALGPQFVLFQLNNPNWKKQFPKCDYIIYVFAWKEINRVLVFRRDPYAYIVSAKYKINKNGNLKMQTLPKFLLYSNMQKLKDSLYTEIESEQINEKANVLFYKILEESYKKSQELYPNSKFIILNYTGKELPCKDKIEKTGIKVIELEDLTDIDIFSSKYKLEDEEHPTATAWEIITPLFIKKAEIK